MPFLPQAYSFLLTQIPSKHKQGRRHARLRNQLVKSLSGFKQILLTQFQGVTFDLLRHSLRMMESSRDVDGTQLNFGVSAVLRSSPKLSVSETQSLLNKHT